MTLAQIVDARTDKKGIGERVEMTNSESATLRGDIERDRNRFFERHVVNHA